MNVYTNRGDSTKRVKHEQCLQNFVCYLLKRTIFLSGLLSRVLWMCKFFELFSTSIPFSFFWVDIVFVLCVTTTTTTALLLFLPRSLKFATKQKFLNLNFEATKGECQRTHFVQQITLVKGLEMRCITYHKHNNMIA